MDPDTKKVIDIINDVKVAMVTTSAGGRLVSRPLTVMEVQDDGDLWIFTSADAHVLSEIAAEPQVNASFAGSRRWVSLNGTASVVDDPAKKHELWNPLVEAFIPEGPDSPNAVLVRVASEHAEYWDNPTGFAGVLARWVKAKATGEPAHPGGSGGTDL